MCEQESRSIAMILEKEVFTAPVHTNGNWLGIKGWIEESLSEHYMGVSVFAQS